MLKKIICIFLVITLILAITFIRTSIFSKATNTNTNKDTRFLDNNIDSVSAWSVYWDTSSNEEEIKKLNEKLKDMSYFAVDFDSNNNLTIPEELLKYYDKTKNYSYEKYITIVNDKGDSQKDVDLLKEILNNHDLRDKNIYEIINIAQEYKFDGVEIDYENINKDMMLWGNYIKFINDLYSKLKDKNLKLKVVLEYNTPFENLTFPEGPTYVLMCYNLHGAFSGPGGKADSKFIDNSIEKLKNVSGNKEFAIATGGFNWGSDGKTIAVTEKEAASLLKEYKAKLNRDKESKCLFFKYKDENNVYHEVWYSDKITLNSWMELIHEKGYNISIWRLGGNLF